MSNNWSNITAADNSRQHNGNVYNYSTHHYPPRQRKSDETLRENDRNRALLKAAAEGQTTRVRKLIKDGADVDFRESVDGLTALHHAVLSGFEDVVDELMSHGADINAVCSEFGPPICFAALKARSNIFETLLSRRALLEAGTDFGSLAHAACCGGDLSIVDALQSRGVTFEVYEKINANRMAEIRSSDTLSLLKQLNARIWMDCLPSHVAAFFGHNQILELLLAFGSQVRATYSEIRTNGPSESWIAESGYTVLMSAAYSGSVETVKMLIDCGAEINARTSSSGATALWIAAGLGRASLIPLLLNANSFEECENDGTNPTAMAVLLQQTASAEKRVTKMRKELKAVTDKTDAIVADMAKKHRKDQEMKFAAHEAEIDKWRRTVEDTRNQWKEYYRELEAKHSGIVQDMRNAHTVAMQQKDQQYKEDIDALVTDAKDDVEVVRQEVLGQQTEPRETNPFRIDRASEAEGKYEAVAKLYTQLRYEHLELMRKFKGVQLKAASEQQSRERLERQLKAQNLEWAGVIRERDHLQLLLEKRRVEQKTETTESDGAIRDMTKRHRQEMHESKQRHVSKENLL